jgi:hypothetical protein
MPPLLLLLSQGLIHVSELLAPAHLVDGEEAEDEAEAYTEVDGIDPAAYYKVRQLAGENMQRQRCYCAVIRAAQG